MARRITRKQLKQDEFVSTIDQLMHWVVSNWRPLAAGLGVVCVVAVVVWVGWRWSSARVERASYDLHEAIAAYDAYHTGGQAQGGGAAVQEKLQRVVDRYGRSDQADVARLYLARLAAAEGRRDEARDLLVEVTTRHRDDAIAGLATLDLIDMRLASGQGGEVAGELEAMITRPDAPLPADVALNRLGELYLERGDTDRAKSTFSKLVEEFPESPFLDNARRRLSELG